MAVRTVTPSLRPMNEAEYAKYMPELRLSIGGKAKPIVKPFWDAARFIPRAFGPFVNMEHILRLGLIISNNPDIDLDDNGPPICDAELQQIEKCELRDAFTTYNKLLTLCPTLKQLLPHAQMNAEDFKSVGEFLDQANRNARTDDISRLRDNVMKYIYEVKGIQIPDSGLDKVKRGWNCEATARMLCPRNLRDEFDADPKKFCQEVRNDRRLVDHDEWPTLAYSETEYDPDNLDWGLLKSPFLVKCWKATFKGPSSVNAEAGPTSGRKGGRKTLSKAYGITTVNEYSIMYVTILARFSLSGVASWVTNDHDGPYTGSEFFKNLLFLFEDEEWRKDTLAWWNTSALAKSSASKPLEAAQTQLPAPDLLPLRVSRSNAQRAAANLESSVGTQT
ncbi:uncharacterized protein B0H18DRAFT_1106292 [Fomitopsis serialis]|uniref:uncharacterized protein n=1 Tax=Fomitopsis serialis TaxID=139415 RepID=UPI002007669C|nr:uncharacterized protein B0H18DRAFT_1106292 [Neoantrodia serialis]KAH9920298.1 hypothetical protein B0H18DRAFT_1106292 [Neoantrodia serialis]